MKRLALVLLLLLPGSAWAQGKPPRVDNGVSLTEFQPETVRLRPGFQRDVSIIGNATIENIYVGDPTVASVTVVNDKRFLITGLAPPDKKEAAATKRTNVLVRDANKNIIANLEVEVGPSGTGGQVVEIHQRVPSISTGGGGRTEPYLGIRRYLCTSTSCEPVSRDKAEQPSQVIMQENTNTSALK